MSVPKYKYFIILILTLFMELLISPKTSFAVQCADIQQSYTYDCSDTCQPLTRTDEFACVDNNDGKGCVTTYAWVGCYLEGNSCIKEESNVTIPCGSGGGGGSTCSNSDWTAPQFIAIHWSTGTGGKMKATISFTSGGANTVSIGASSNWVSATAYCNPAFGALDGCIIFTGLGGNGTNVSSPLVVDGFTKGTVYYFSIAGLGPPGCYGAGEDKTRISSCVMTPTTMDFKSGDPAETLASEVVSKYVWGTSPTNVRVGFVQNPAGIVAFNPLSITNTYPYQTSVSPAVAQGSTVLKSNVYLNNVLDCASNYTSVTITQPTCSINLLPSTVVTRNEGGASVAYRASVTVDPPGTTINRVNFSTIAAVGTPVAANVSPTYDTTPDLNGYYTTTANIVSNINPPPNPYEVTIKASANIGGRVDVCNKTSTLKVNDVPVVTLDAPWWKVIDGDITTNENIVSKVESASKLIDNGDGGYPGVPVYGTSLTTQPGGISSLGWNANTQTFQPKSFDYSYFEGLIPEDVDFGDIGNLSNGNGTPIHYGYEWYKVEGTLDTPVLTYINFGNRKVILFVSGDLNIKNEIFVTDGVGFFGAFVGGNINVDGGITRAANPSLEGIYLTDGDFSTGEGASKLWVRGSIAALGGFNLRRNLADDATAAEIFEFAPDQVLLFPKVLMFKRTKWAEVAP
ncbi:MAG TPA: hypothetical protein VI795_01950 [Patescibacteria group bacterium]|nr:hypothetical protein [Patescibacteria group bacterium]